MRPGDATSAQLTVVIPVWDRYCALLPGCVDSVLAGGGARPDVVVVDNASRVPLPVLPISVRVVRTPHRLTAGAARNAGLAHVSTPFVLFVDADDELLPGIIARLSAALEADPGAVAAVSRHLLRGPSATAQPVAPRSPRWPVRLIAHSPTMLALLTLRFDCFGLVSCAVIRTSAARDCGGFGDANLAEDWMLRSALAGRGRILFDRRPGVLVRVRLGSLWHREHTRSELEDMFAAFRERRMADPALPRWMRRLLPLIAIAHARDAVRMTRAGAFSPEDHGLIGPERVVGRRGGARA